MYGRNWNKSLDISFVYSLFSLGFVAINILTFSKETSVANVVMVCTMSDVKWWPWAPLLTFTSHGKEIAWIPFIIAGPVPSFGELGIRVWQEMFNSVLRTIASMEVRHIEVFVQGFTGLELALFRWYLIEVIRSFQENDLIITKLLLFGFWKQRFVHKFLTLLKIRLKMPIMHYEAVRSSHVEMNLQICCFPFWQWFYFCQSQLNWFKGQWYRGVWNE